jgi:cell division transport system permease protein
MKIFRIFGKSVREAFKSVFRNFSLSVASISCTTITLIIVAIALIATYNVNSITKKIEDVLTIVVFVDKKASEEDIKKLSDEIYATDNVDKKNTVYNSKEKLKEDLSQDEKMKVLLDTVDENPLQATFVVKVTDVKHLTDTAEKFKNYEHVANVKYGESLVNKLLRMFSIVRNGCVIAVIALIIVTAFLIGNTIKITIFSRRTEIGIMRLVGTSNTVIKLPFLIEGFVLGIIGSIIPILLTIYGYSFLYDYSGGNLFTELVVLVQPSEIVYSASLVLLIVGGIVGMFGSVRAVRKFLKV